MTRLLELAVRPIIHNVTLASANTEYSQELHTGLRKFTIQCRNPDIDIKIAFVSGESGTNYLTVLGNSAYNEDLIATHPIGLTIYIQTTSSAAPVVEIVEWTISPV